MRHDPARVADTVGWLRKAKEDLDIAAVPFKASAHSRIALKVIDDRGNELMVVKLLTEAHG